ncbi:hypothetical protein [Chthonobacter albigriseus]|uniref:hypothetical protein n=1 Tax=Chthonobacter albigriseus TaxID=1683161 RepID=UPI0015EEED08|nr:hypothetical protein [Chthonobacter albigriseus]
MTQAELIQALPAGRLPPSLIELGAADLLALFGVGLVLGAILAAILAPFLKRTPSRRARVRATRGLAPQERVLAVAKLLGEMPEPLRPSAYVPWPSVTDAEIEHAAMTARLRRR